MKFGCHVSIREGYLGAAKTAKKWNAQAYQYFPKNPRSLSVKAFDKKDAEHSKQYCMEHKLTSVAHSPYPTNLTPYVIKKDSVILSLLNDLEIADSCGSVGVVVHFGKDIDDQNPLAGYQLMIEMLNNVLSTWEGDCKLLLENNAGKPGAIGTTLEELVQVRKLTAYPDKIGFCLDTCHAFSSGLWTGENTKELMEKGQDLGFFDHLEVIHLNNSKYPSLSGKDRHANIFDHGYIKKNQWDQLMHVQPLQGIPFVLETPDEFGITHEEEIAQLRNEWGGFH